MARFLGREISRKEFLKRVGNVSQIASVKSYELSEGRADGLKAFDVTTGSGLDFTVLESKCLDIYNMKFKGINLNFVSKPGLVSPEFFNPHGAEFLRSFQGGMLYTCGLSNVGPACNDNGIDYCLHGRIGNTPADKTSVISTWKGDEYVIKIAGEMREAALFNENLVLKRVLTAKLGGKSVMIHDEVENQGFEEQALMILYHFNLGYPLLDEGAKFILPGREVLPRDEEAGKGMDSFNNFSSPIDQFKEQVFYHKAASDKEGNTVVALVNRKLDIGVFIKYNITQLPRLIQWKSMGSGDYVLGIEPANCLVEDRVKERERGTLRKLIPFEKAVFDIETGVLEGAAELDEFERKINACLNY